MDEDDVEDRGMYEFDIDELGNTIRHRAEHGLGEIREIAMHERTFELIKLHPFIGLGYRYTAYGIPIQFDNSITLGKYEATVAMKK